tara:strand:+ start:543 stop:1514 length:972 start_codon:yes stop_codon:yes gene_type:complete
MSIIRADSIKNRGGNGAPDFPKGLTVTGVVTATTLNQTVTGDVNVGSNIKIGSASGIVTATTFVGALTGNVTGNASGTAGGLTGTPAITVGNIIAADGTFSGNVSIAKTLTYEDVKNVDSVGIVTAREGVFIPDSKELKLGNTAASPDLKIYHSGSHSYIDDAGTGDLYIRGAANIRLTDLSDNKMILCQDGGETQLYHNGIEKLNTSSAGITVSGSVTDDKGDVRVIPKVAKTSSYTLVASDAGKCISTNSGVTIPNAVFAAGQAVTIWNDSSSSITITQGSGFQLRKAGETSTGNVTLTNFGLATLWWNTGGTAVISGNLS